MATRIMYVREKNVQEKKFRNNGLPRRGNPVACVMTTVDKDNDQIRYAFSATHPKDNFVKSLSKHIAKKRLESEHVRVLNGVPATGHDITVKVMQDILDTTTAVRLRTLVAEWLDAAALPAEFIPRPAVAIEPRD